MSLKGKRLKDLALEITGKLFTVFPITVTHLSLNFIITRL